MITKSVFSQTTPQRILDFLCQNPYQSFYAAEIAGRTLLSKGGTNQTLRKMAKEGLLKVEKKGRMTFYQVDSKSAVVRQFKVLKNVARLEDIVKKIKPLTERIVLFGSCAAGEDTQESDVDIFVVSQSKNKVVEFVPEFIEKRKVQLVVKTPQEFIDLDKKEPVFSQELKKGILLWEKE